ncbi:hypothetical protein AB0M28_05245 [Streptomyces sp. NPDC051940]|uniref:hypothetical protein n=1 Tax=Streptomyces sp. NPDC051940 TaxID=3155675 RepID=UPI00343D1594
MVRRARRGAFLVAGTAAALLAVAGPAGAVEVWCGGGIGPTAETAVNAAIDDAITSASWQGPVECELYGEPEVWEVFNDPYRGHFFRASVQMTCE